MRLKGKAAIVTGAASGIGRATALLFVREGARILATDIDAEGLEETAAGIRECGGDLVTVGADVSKEAEVTRVIAGASHTFGGIDILFHAAGVTSFQEVEQCDESEWERVQTANAKSAFLCAKAAIPLLRNRGGGSILYVSSINGILGAPGLAAYSVSKAAIIGLTRSLALELARDRIRVNCLCPASVDTPMLQEMFDRTDDPERAREENIGRHPLGRIGVPEDVAYFALFLASDESNFVTGGAHVVDGGAILARM